MKTLQPPASHHVQAACGWLGLGDPVEAEAELALLPPPAQRHPDVLQVRWQLAACQQSWRECADLAKSITQIAPERRFGWIHLAYSLHRLGRTEEAREILLYALDMFTPNATMAFYLSQYCCRLGNLDEGRIWLKTAFALVEQDKERARLKAKALTEPDLAPLRKQILSLA